MTRTIGVIGTGYWADRCHAAGIEQRDDLEFVGVWGRDVSTTDDFAHRHRTAAFRSPAELFATVDLVSFAVPPFIQAALAPEAADAGCHLLLEKPIATSSEAADRIVEACRRNGVLSVVNFSNLLGGVTGRWMDEVVIPETWDGGSVTILSDLRVTDTPFSNSEWRRLDNGSLWDAGPHALSLLVAGLGPVSDVQSQHGVGDTYVLSLGHDLGGVSSVLLSYSVAAGASKFRAEFWGAEGFTAAPTTPPSRDPSLVGAIAPALAALVAAIESGRPSPYDAAFGAEIVQVLAQADQKEH
ncbi:MAG TPA: Gfo/Idh/MocA family oxidoreductase [Steroidobacteraceae bacterium]|jgi:predicted dehydrogenase